MTFIIGCPINLQNVEQPIEWIWKFKKILVFLKFKRKIKKIEKWTLLKMKRTGAAETKETSNEHV